MADKISTLVEPVALADCLRTAAQDMSADNYHDWAFLVELAADALVAQKQGTDRIAQLFEVHRNDFERRLPSMLNEIKARSM